MHKFLIGLLFLLTAVVILVGVLVLPTEEVATEEEQEGWARDWVELKAQRSIERRNELIEFFARAEELAAEMGIVVQRLTTVADVPVTINGIEVPSYLYTDVERRAIAAVAAHETDRQMQQTKAEKSGEMIFERKPNDRAAY